MEVMKTRSVIKVELQIHGNQRVLSLFLVILKCFLTKQVYIFTGIPVRTSVSARNEVNKIFKQIRHFYLQAVLNVVINTFAKP